MSKPNNILIQKITLDYLKHRDIQLRMARMDKVNALASGNKVYKLQPIIEYAKINNFRQIISFGGAFSNHIHALALMTKLHQIESIAIIRGEAHYAGNPTLSDAQSAGMKLLFVSREEYKLRNNAEYLLQLQQRYPDALIIPEGGSSKLAIPGCANMAKEINEALETNDVGRLSNSFLAVPSGTGATAAGLICGLAADQQLIAYSVLKDDSLNQRIDNFIEAENEFKSDQYSIEQADFGGYAKFDKHLLDFILIFLDQTDILLDPIYTSKMCLRVVQQIEMNEFADGDAITLIHSGGLQGWRGMKKRVETLGGEAAWQQINVYLENYC